MPPIASSSRKVVAMAIATATVVEAAAVVADKAIEFTPINHRSLPQKHPIAIPDLCLCCPVNTVLLSGQHCSVDRATEICSRDAVLS